MTGFLVFSQNGQLSAMNAPTLNNQITTNAFKRLLFMALLFALFGLVRLLLWAVVVIQLLTHIFTGKVTRFGLRWGGALSSWIYQAMLFMSYNTEQMPFPFKAFSPEDD